MGWSYSLARAHEMGNHFAKSFGGNSGLIHGEIRQSVARLIANIKGLEMTGIRFRKVPETLEPFRNCIRSIVKMPALRELAVI